MWAQKLLARGNALVEKIGDVVAPVQSPVHELHIAIRKHDLARSLELLRENYIDASSLNAVGTLGGFDYTPLHVASEHDFVACVEYILDEGGDVDVADSRTRETPLHRASRAGAVTVAKLLVARGASLIVRNANHQTPYDVGNDLNLRQWLLPLMLRAEAEQQPAHQQQPAPHYQHQPSPIKSGSPPSVLPHPATSPPPVVRMPPPPAAMPPAAPQMSSNAPKSAPSSEPFRPMERAAPLKRHGSADQQPQPPALEPAAATMPPPPPLPQMPAPSSTSPPPPAAVAAGGRYSFVSKRTDAYGRYADGFHSSSSDPVLAEKYGHIKADYSHLPPPPTMGSMMGAPTATSSQPQGPPPGGSRYVNYDPSGGARPMAPPPIQPEHYNHVSPPPGGGSPNQPNVFTPIRPSR